MPEKQITKPIPKLLKRASLDLMVHSYVLGVKDTLETVSTRKAIEMFFQRYNIDEDEYSFETAKRTVERMNNELLELYKS